MRRLLVSNWAFALCSSLVLLGCGTHSYNVLSEKAGRSRTPEARALSRVESDMRDVLKAHARLDPKPIESLSPVEARRQPSPADAVAELIQRRGEVSPRPLPAVSKVYMSAVPGPDANQIPVRVYVPSGNTPFPMIVYFHGGGWVLADLDTYDASARALADKAEAVVVSVDYRRAPEHKFPAAHEDAYAAFQYIAAHAREFGGDPARVAVVGESAGGNLANAVSLLAKHRGGIMPIHQVLVYPITNYGFDSPSFEENAHAKPLNAAMMPWFFRNYLNTEQEGLTSIVSPLRASNEELSGLPPTTVITAEIDPLRSEGMAYAEKLSHAGVPVTATEYKGVTHEFFGMAAVVDTAEVAQNFAAQRLETAFDSIQ